MAPHQLIPLCLLLASAWGWPTMRDSNQGGQISVIVFDAGSTGTRAYLFTFLRDNSKVGLKLIFAKSKKFKPGLSAYRDKPKEAADNLKALVDFATDLVPESKWRTTDVIVRATAGLRLLGDNERDNILNEIRQMLKGSSLRVGRNAVGMLSGRDEGVLAWLSVNYLLNNFNNGQSTAGIVEMGGGSTQVAFVNPSNDPTYTAKENYIGKTFNLYSHSYLGLGIRAAQQRMVGYKTPCEGTCPSVYYSPCFPDGYKGQLKFGADKVQLAAKSVPKGSSRFETCYNDAKRIVHDLHVKPVKQLSKKDHALYGLAVFMYVAKDAKLIGKHKGHQVRVDDYRRKAVEICKTPLEQKPYLCLNLCVIYALLNDGYQLPASKELTAAYKINNYITTWAIGLGLQAAYEEHGNNNN